MLECRRWRFLEWCMQQPERQDILSRPLRPEVPLRGIWSGVSQLSRALRCLCLQHLLKRICWELHFEGVRLPLFPCLYR